MDKIMSRVVLINGSNETIVNYPKSEKMPTITDMAEFVSDNCKLFVSLKNRRESSTIYSTLNSLHGFTFAGLNREEKKVRIWCTFQAEK